MAESPLFFYDEVVRRYLLQFARMFSMFSVEYGRSQETLDNGDPAHPGHALIRVPVRYGDASRQAQTIMQQNSASSMPSAPLMTFYIQGLDYDRKRVQEPNFISKIAVRQRKYVPDPLDPQHLPGTYETTQGNAFTIERPMPVPYKLTLNLDIWTTNTNQKLQLWEQIAPLFNPALEIQATDSYIDWTTISVVELVSSKFTSKTIPVGTEDPIDIATFTFEIPIWISPPVKVKKLGVIERIIASVYDEAGDLSSALDGSDILYGTRQMITPYGYQIFASGINANGPYFGRIQCLALATPQQPPNFNIELDSNVEINAGAELFWHPLINVYGVLKPGISYIILVQPDETEVKCYVAFDPSDDRFLIVTGVEHMPSNSGGPVTYVDSVVNPLLSGPGAGNPPLPTPVAGQTYLFTENTGNADYLGVDPSHYPPAQPGQPFAYAYAWASTDNHPLIANTGDIVQYQITAGVGSWVVIFDAAAGAEPFYVTNLVTDVQYRWTGTEWVKSVDGWYGPGEWHLTL